MSFFNTLQQYVNNINNSVASLSISPRRFSMSASAADASDGAAESTEPSVLPLPLPESPPVRVEPSGMKGPSALPPRSPGRFSGRTPGPRSAAVLLQERSKSLKLVTVPPTTSSTSTPSPLVTKKGSARAASLKEGTMSTAAAMASSKSWMANKKELKLTPTFARSEGSRRTAWPLFAITGSGVQESDGSFFESFTALSWKQENRRLQVLREDETHGSPPPSVHANHQDIEAMSNKELEQLYVEVLYTIRHKIGAHSAQYPHHFKEDLVRYAQAAFNIGPDHHHRCQAMASEEKPPIVVLNVIVIEAEGLEAKDPNGFSDPYCMLGIHPGSCKADQQQHNQPQQQLVDTEVPQASSESGDGAQPSTCIGSAKRGEERRDSLISLALGLTERQKRHHFRLSFKRKEPTTCNASGSNGHGSHPQQQQQQYQQQHQQRDRQFTALPAKFIRATSVKGQTLNPKWNEKFRFDIDDVSSDTLHLDIWDHDDEYSVLDAVSKLNEVRGVKGLGRFFKQIAQSARSGNQDDFLGCVNIPIQDIPSTGLEVWYKLEGRSQRSTIQGRIRLKLFLSTREDLGTSEEDNWTEIKQQEKLHGIFIDYELSVFKNAACQWSGELSQQALTILHQHAIQGDVTALQSAVVRWVAFARKMPDKSINFSVLYYILYDLESQWLGERLSREEEEALGQSLAAFVEYSLSLLRRMRFLFSARNGNLTGLEYLLKCLHYLENTHVFRRCCPFHKEIRGEIVAALRKGVVDWYTYEQKRCMVIETNPSVQVAGMILLTNRLYADLMRTLQIYDEIFQRVHNIPYFTIVYKSHIKMVNQDFSARLDGLASYFQADSEVGIELTSPVFELHVALLNLQKLHDHLPVDEFPNQSVSALDCHEWFRTPLKYWLFLARAKALHRVRMAVQLDSHTNVEPYLIHSTSAIDITSCFYQICEFWKQIAWPDQVTAFPFVFSIVEMVTACATVYADLIFGRVQATGFFADDSKVSLLSVEVCVPLNDLEHVKCALAVVPQTLQVSAVASAFDSSHASVDDQRIPALARQRSLSLMPGSSGHGQSPGAHAPTSSSYDSSARLAFQTLLETVREHFEAKLLRICGCMAEKVRAELKKNIFHLAWSPDSLPVGEAVAPLMDNLDELLLGLEPNLLPAAFHRCVIAFWDVFLFELWNQADIASGEKVCKFYQRLHEALEILVQFLHAEGKGPPLASLRSPTYRRVAEQIQLHKTKTDDLIDLYYAGRLEQQQQAQLAMDGAPYGVLSLRAYFHHDSLCVEILSARDVIPLDPNGLSDPFVIIELLPRRNFATSSEQQTTIRRRTLHPTFDECFEFPVTLEQCRHETAMLLFTVMDYDVLTTNDFAGEALLSLNTIPGVATAAHGLDNTFHGLKQIDLFLMHQSNKRHPILAALECRTTDRIAQDFVRKQKERISS